MSKGGGTSGNKFRTSFGLPVSFASHHKPHHRGRPRHPASLADAFTSCVRKRRTTDAARQSYSFLAVTQVTLICFFQVAAVMNCADNTGAKNLYILAVKGIKVRFPPLSPETRSRAQRLEAKTDVLRIIA
jgi:ribosomal protein L14